MSILDRIVASKQQQVHDSRNQFSIAQLEKRASKAEKRPFLASLQKDGNGVRIIAEIKKASPSKGVIRNDFDVRAIARSFEQHGACCLSVLTDVEFFQGNNAFLQQAKAACALPVLRKDFLIDEWQILESASLGADAILLICAILTDEQLQRFFNLAQEYSVDCVVEVHNNREMQRALQLQAPLIGINNRDLHTFTTDLQITTTLVQQARAAGSSATIISESGIETKKDIAFLSAAGVDGFLVGERLMQDADPASALQELVDYAVN